MNIKNMFKSDKPLLILIIVIFFLLLYVSFREFSDSTVHPSLEISKQAIIDNRNLLLVNRKLIEDNIILVETSLKRDNSNYHSLNEVSGNFKQMQEQQRILEQKIDILITEIDNITKQLKLPGQ